MTIREHLASAGVELFDAEVLLCHILRCDRSWIAAHDDDVLSIDHEQASESAMSRRRLGEPVAYITGTKEFYGRSFFVRAGVLLPWPCTEHLVTAALDILAGRSVDLVQSIDEGIVCAVKQRGPCDAVRTVVDVGTGSGCIAVTIACERPDVRCIGIDVSPTATVVAAENARRHNVADRVDVLIGNALKPIAELKEDFVVVTNPPYVADERLLDDDVRTYEPCIALMGGGSDGGDVLRLVVAQAVHHPRCRGIVAECLQGQASIVTDA